MSVVVLVAAATGPFGGPGWLAVAALSAIVVLIALQGAEADAKGYAATMSLQVSHSLALVRFAVSDLFSAALIVRSARDILRGRERFPRTTLSVALGCLIGAFAVATFVGYRRIGHLTSYVVLNRAAGILFLVVGFFAAIQFLRNSERVELVIRWFLDGVGIANALALIASLTQLLGIQNLVYIAGSFRLNGWVGNPSLYGGILATAILLELGLMASVQAHWRSSRIRWLNLILLSTSMLLTLSRSAWLCLAVGAIALRVAVAFEPRSIQRRPSYRMVVNLWGLAPILALAGILAVNLGYGFETLTQRVARLNDSAAQQETIAAAAAATAAAAAATAAAAETSAASTTPDPVDPMVVFSREGTMLNARGLLDRAAIESFAWSQYTRTKTSMLFGVGLGTIFATSASTFGYPIIIHNTFTWFLVELGPLGFACLIWVWLQTARNLWKAYRLADGRRSLVLGLIGGFGSMSVFMFLNEAFYHRHYWLLMILADRVAALRDWSPAVESGAGPPY